MITLPWKKLRGIPAHTALNQWRDDAALATVTATKDGVA